MKTVSVLLFVLLCLYGVTAELTEDTSVVNVTKPTILHLHVHTDIKLRYAKTVINTKVSNRANVSQEVTFNVVLPETAFISEFQMVTDSQVYNAYVKEKEAARQEYAEAVQQGRSAAHVAMNARDSQRFTVSLNVEPEKKVTFILTYEELLSRKLGVYKQVLNLDPGQIVQDFNVVVRIKEFSNITKLHVPALLRSNEVSENITDSTNPLATIERPTPQTAVIRYSPTQEQQRELNSEGVKGQFVVEYDVDRTQHAGEVLMSDGYFVHFFAPDELPPLRKHITFVLDVSGSMNGRKIEQLKQAMKAILKELNQDDLFSIVVFSSTVQVWDYNLTNSFQEERLGRLQGMRWGDYGEEEEEVETRNRHVIASATEQNITRAKEFIQMLSPVGATNINDAVLKGLEISKLAVARHNNTPEVNNDLTLNQTEQNQTSTQQKPPQPILVFLTDGKANVGVSNLVSIVKNVERANTGNCSIYSLALGAEADFNFLKKLSLRNNGFARKIYEAADTALQLRDFYRQVASPLITEVSFNYQPEQVVRNTLTKLQYRMLFSGSELVVAGKLRSSNFSGTVKGIAKSGNSVYQFTPSSVPEIATDTINNTTATSVNTTTSVTNSTSTNSTAGFMERLWAYLTIQQLLEKKAAKSEEDNDSSDSKSDENESSENSDNNQTALEYALKYSFVTPLTSLVVVKPNETKAVDTEDASEFGVETRSGGVQRMAPSRSNQPNARPPTSPAGNTRMATHHGRSDVQVHRTHVLANISDVTWLVVTANNTVQLQTTGNGTAEIFQLAGPEQINDAHGTCTTPEDRSGHCRHFRHCVLSAFTSRRQDFLPFFCRIQGFLGVCCPDYLQPVSS